MPDRDSDLLRTIDRELMRLLPRSRQRCGILTDALHYAVFPGGKRLRPILTVLGAQVFGKSEGKVLGAACAVEFIHTSSLVIDDLPCMDDADLRRGNPALHLVYGQDIALLTGIALLNQAYAIFGRVPELIREATDCIGLEGMIGGQAIDLTPDSAEILLVERNRKTSALIRLAATAGALACGVSRDEVAPLAEFGQRLGQAYQIYDDMRDSGDASQASGKTPGQDLRHKRPNHAVRSESESWGELASGVNEARRTLTEAYGEGRVAGLLGFVDSIFTAVTIPARYGAV
jgi:geranylgeranyl diphosphate synthase type II